MQCSTEENYYKNTLRNLYYIILYLYFVSGIIITFYGLLLACGSLFLSNGVETYVSMIQSLDLSRPLIFIIKIILGVPFVYHYFNGIRFCMWNAGRWLEMKDVYATAKKSFVATAVVTLIFALI